MLWKLVCFSFLSCVDSTIYKSEQNCAKKKEEEMILYFPFGDKCYKGFLCIIYQLSMNYIVVSEENCKVHEHVFVEIKYGQMCGFVCK